MKILLCLIMSISLSSFASELVEKKFSIFTPDNYYACDFVENQTAGILEDLGATNVEVSCTGGLQIHFPSSHSVRLHVSYDAPVVSGNYEVVELEFRDSCALYNKLVPKLLEDFEVKTLERRGTCFGHSSRLRYRIEMLK